MKRLLLVDDDNELRNLLSSYLFDEGFFINSVHNVQSALVIIKQDRPDLIITDIMMNNLDGYDFIKLLKWDILFSDIPVVFLTAKGMTYDRIKGYNLGCHAYLTKPFNPQELLAIIKNIFNNIELLKINLLNISLIDKLLVNPKIFKFFTHREKNILKLVMQGYMNKEIAIQLNISLRNVEKYISRLLNKTNTRNRTELVQVVNALNLFN
uniref:TctD transcriptional regulator n=1 Tax=Acrosorium ciliolatum TaxID=1550622 RepID=A0A1Z1M1X6_9FLOR|nr:hypothetical protein [Acrosorium ciliolatum]ARW60087.1 hypothetical protein [Acrosorium ciliolatum]